MGTDVPLKCPKCSRSLAPGARFCDRCGVPVQSASIDPLSTAPLRVGELLEGKWKLEGKLGAGGMGAVFLARDVALDRKVAIKILAAQLCDDQEFVTRFEREARTTAKLEHPNIVPVHAVGRHQGRPFIVMKALEGMTLSKAIKSRAADGRRMGRDEILPLFKQLCAGLGFIHEKGYVHRDVKSGNIFLGHDGHVTVLDFGVLRDATAERITRSGVLVGTPTYASPEQVQGAEVDSRADLYAVGVLLFECITLKAPFVGDPITLMKQHSTAEPPDLSVLAPGLPPKVPEVVKKALSKKPADRFPSAQVLFQALESAWPEAAAVRRLAVEPECVETAIVSTSGLDLRVAPQGETDPSAETLPADSVAVGALLSARARRATPSPQPEMPVARLAAPGLAPAPVADTPSRDREDDWQTRTVPAAERPAETEEQPTVRIRNVKQAQADAGLQPPVEPVLPPTERLDPKMLADLEPSETTGELVRKLKPHRWPYAVGALLAVAAAAAAFLQWGPK
ncbi:MAG: protein kinase [Myxococcales bacterium]